MNKSTILIIEDNPISRKLLKTTLESESYHVVEAIDGTSALLEASRRVFDLIIQDLVLPDIDGFTLNQKLRTLSTVKDIPIFILSGFLSQPNMQSTPPGFTTFFLKPIDPPYLLDMIKAHLPIVAPPEILADKRKHILIADDNAIQLKLLSIQLENAGFEVTCAKNGILALRSALSRPPNAIITDVLMPCMDGFSLCLEIKRNPKLCHIPVVLISSHYLEDEDLILAKNAGASRYLMRTTDVENLISEIHTALNTPTPEYIPIPTGLTEDLKEEHTIRSMRQLEQQVVDNTKLTERCAILMSQLSLIDGIASALTTSTKNVDESLKELLYVCLDATGVSKGALYIKRNNGSMVLSQQIGYTDSQKEQVETLFGLSTLIPKIFEVNVPLAIPSESISDENANQFLDVARLKSALIVPLFSGSECLGILLLGSDMENLSSQKTKEFLRTLGMQFGQSIALASTFEKLGSSEKRYRQLVEISPDAIFIEQDEKFVYANSSALQLLKAKSLDDLLMHSLYDFFPADYRNIIEEYIQSQKTQASTTLSEGKIINLKGDILDIEIVVSPFIYQEKPAVYMIMRNITERKRSALHLEIQYAIAWILAESETLFVATSKILQIICERLEWDCGTIWAVDKKNNVLRCTRVWQNPKIQSLAFKQESQGLALAPGVALPGYVWENQKATWRTALLLKDFTRKASISEIGLQTGVAFPIIYENEVLGVIEFFSKNIIQPNNDLLLWFESIGNQFGLFLVRKHMERQMLYLAEHDVLTGLSNRSLLEQYLNTTLTTAQERSQKLAILFLDLDHFKYINDSMGHQAGDLLLKEISERFRHCLRPQDTIGRFGGDEFIIVLPDISHNEEVIDIIGRIQDQLSRPIVLKEKEFSIKASIGVSVYPEDGNTVHALIKGADIAMYAAKERGRNNFQFCTHEMTSIAENRGILQSNLRHALENDEFLLYYQPKINIATQRVSGMEALIRWKTRNDILLPGSFISAAEGSDLIIPIGEWVLKTACKQNKAWQEAGLPPITMSINLSVLNLNNQLLQVMEKTLAESNLEPHSIEVELTESALMENVENNIQILCSLKEMGLVISIDDFGTGYSSLSYLKRFPIDTIKIDQSFVRDIATDAEDAAIVTAIIVMAHSLGFKVIAEGVETEGQLKFLCEHGCDEIQGFYFSRPLPASEATQFMQNGNLHWGKLLKNVASFAQAD